VSAIAKRLSVLKKDEVETFVAWAEKKGNKRCDPVGSEVFRLENDNGNKIFLGHTKEGSDTIVTVGFTSLLVNQFIIESRR
jgi:hypothetical protein